MGKTSRWFRSLLGAKKPSDSSPAPECSLPTTKENDKRALLRSLNGNERCIGGTREGIDANKHAMAVAAATTAVAEAALAAAKAAAEVVRMTGRRPAATSYGGGRSGRRRELAAVKIQSAFRAYLARRALRALKGLVKLQALVRGRIVRKQTADMLRRMQAMARIQARACANRVHTSPPLHSMSKYSQFREPRTRSKSKMKDVVDLERTHLNSNWLDRWMEERSWNSQRDSTSLKTQRVDDKRIDKILEVDTWKPHFNSNQSDTFSKTPRRGTLWNFNDCSVTTFNPLLGHSTTPQNQNQNQNPSVSSGEALSLKFPTEVGQFSPDRSDCSRLSFFSDYVGYPNYMANTESYLAKVRSQSVPRRRMQVEKLGSTKGFGRGFWDAENISEGGLALHANFRCKAHLGSGFDSSYGGR